MTCIRISSVLALALSACASPNPEREEAPAVSAESKAPAFDKTPIKPGATAEARAKAPPQPAAPAKVPAPPDVAEPPADAERTASGLASRVLQAGTGSEHPSSWDEVEVHYTGWTKDGKMFGDSRGRGTPVKFNLFQVIPGWSEGVQLMVQGEKRRFWIPSKIAYDNRPGAPQGDLTFDIELLSIKRNPEPPKTPSLTAPAGAKKTKSGVAYQILARGSGARPAEADTVTMNFTGWLSTGKMFDSTVVSGKPTITEPRRLVPGWKEVLLLMREGDRALAWIPADLAFKGRPGGPPGDLVLDVKLESVKVAPKPPPTPKNVDAPPESATKTASGLAYKRLTKGTGDKHPEATSKVTVHYTGWTTDGKMFDSSIPRGKPSSMPLNRVIKGWTEGVQLMVEGDKMRFWIPQELAYQGRPGKPGGMLVFDIELVEIAD